MPIRYLSGITVDSTVLVVDAVNDRVGIGTASPTHLLSLSRATQAAAYQLNINNAGGISDGNFTGIRFSQDSNAATELGNIKLHYYSTGATDLSFGTRYSPTAVYIQSGGNVGIGTTSPGAKLDVNGTISASGEINSISNNARISLYRSTGTNYFDWSSGQPLYFSTETTAGGSGRSTKMVLLDNGNVGIGTTGPYFPLHVQGPTGFNGEAKNNGLLFDTASATTGTGGGLAFGGYSNGTGGDVYHFGNIQGIKENSTAGNYASAMLFSTRANGATPLEQMRISSAGNVGIGTTGPTEKLHVSGRIMAAGSGYTLNPTAPIFGQYSSTRGYVQVPTNGQFEIWNGGTATIATFHENYNSIFYGNVGIGTTAPNAKLNVFGTGGGASVTVQEDLLHIGGNELGGVGGYAGIRLAGTASSSYGVYIRGVKTLAHGNYWNDALTFSVTRTNTETTIDEAMRITSDGNVGIGTTSPQSKLTLNTNTTSPGSMLEINNRGDLTAGSWSAIRFGLDSGTYPGQYGKGGIIYESRDGYNRGKLHLAVDSVADNGSITLTDSILTADGTSGNVGIGTTAPGYKLDVAGGDVRFVAAASTDALVRIIASNYSTEYDARLFLGENDTNGMTIEYDGSNNVGFIGMNSSTEPTGAFSKRIRMSRDGSEVSFPVGNVGIGTTSPREKLQVAGNTVIGSAGLNSYKTNLYLTYSAGADETWFRIYLPQDYVSSNNGGTVKVRVLWEGDHATFGAYQEYQISYKTYYPATPYLKFSNVLCTNKTSDFSTASTYYPPSSTPDVLFYDNTDGYLYVKVKGTHTAYNTARYIEAEIFGRTTAQPTIATTTAPGAPVELTKTIQFLPQEGNIYASGSVGIGTTSPVRRLDVNGGEGVRVSGYGLRNSVQSANSGFIQVGGSNNLYGLLDFNAYDSNTIFEVSNTYASAAAELRLGGGFITMRAGATPSEAVRITSTGNVGIGTTNPTEKLTIFGGVGSPATSGTGANGNLAIESSNGNSLYFGSYAASPYGCWMQVSNYVDQGIYYPIILNPLGGNVGIGTTIPSAELQVNKASDVTIAMSNSTAVTSGNRGNLAFYNSAVSTVALIKATAVTDNVGTQLEFYTRPAAGSLTQVLTIASTGAATFSSSVTAAGNSVVIRGSGLNNTVVSSTTLWADTAPLISVNNTSTTANTAAGFQMQVGGGSAIAGVLGIAESTSQAAMGLFTGGSGTVAEKMRITSAGNVGIGTTAPATKLEIAQSTDNTDGPTLRIANNANTLSNGQLIGAIDFYNGDDSGGGDAVGAFIRSYTANAVLPVSSQYLSFAAGGSTETIRLNASGNLSIGNTNDTYKLDVSGTGRFSGDLLVKNTTTHAYLNIDAAALGAAEAGVMLRVGGTDKWEIYTANNDGNLSFWSAGQGIKFTIASTGAATFSSSVTATTFLGDLNGTINTLTTGATQTAGNNSTLIATTAYADAAAAAVPIGNYLPLAGGTLTGALGGTSATFTGKVTLPAEESGDYKLVFEGAAATSGFSTVDEAGGAALYIGANSIINASGVVVTKNTLLPSLGINLEGFSEDFMGFYTSLTGNPQRRMTITSGGDVGIGTDSPTTTLSVKGTSSNGINVIGVGTTATRCFLGLNSANKGYLFVAGSSGENPAVITSQGNSYISTNLGIGTTTPDATLEIYNISSTSDGDGSATETLSGQDSILLQAPTGADEETNGSITWRNGNRRRAMITSVSENVDGDFKGISFYTQGTDGAGDIFESMRIAHSGNVGIGTTGPGAKLQVSGGGFDVYTDYSATNSAIGISSLKKTDGMSALVVGRFHSTNNSSVLRFNYVGSNSASNYLGLGFYGNDDLLVIKPSGNVLINTTTDSGFKLDVAGTFRASTSGSVAKIQTSTNASEVLQLYNTGGASGAVQGITHLGINFFSTGTNSPVRITASQNGTSGYAGDMFFSTRSDNSDVAPTEKVRILSGGNVGIGTDVPGKKLVVYDPDPDNGLRVSNSDGINMDVLSSASGGIVGTNSNHPLFFYTNNTEKAQITAAGNFGIGNTPSYKLDVTGDARINSGALGVNFAPSATAGRIDASNDIVAYQTSDKRLKENITPITNALEKVKSLTGVEFDWKEETKHVHGYEGHDTGIIAQQVLEVMPTAVRTNDTGYLSVRYEKLIGLLIEGMKEQQAQIDELKAQINDSSR